MKQTTPIYPTDVQKLLDVANSSSERVAILHAAFIAACTYVLVIVTGRTDLDLLIGKGIKLPFLDTEVPIVGFFLAAPYILVIVHFNLLLHLQLLSRKLFAFDRMAPQNEEIGNLRDQLHIFPFTYYLAGKMGHNIQPFLSLMVSITIILLPLLTLFSLQVQFLAYQSESVTWLQRLAIWLDLALMAYFWPLILSPHGNVKSWWYDFYQIYLSQKKYLSTVILSIFGLILSLFSTNIFVFTVGLSMIGLAFFICFTIGIIDHNKSKSHIKSVKYYVKKTLTSLLILITVMLIPLSVYFIFTEIQPNQLIRILIIIVTLELIIGLLIMLPISHTARGYFLLPLSITLIIPLSLSATVNGEFLEEIIIKSQLFNSNETIFCKYFLTNKRILNLNDRSLFSATPNPEIVAQLRSGQWTDALPKIESLDLQGRNLRHAQLSNALLCKANLRNANLQDADLSYAQLQGANMAGVKIINGDMSLTQLQGANLESAQLQGASLYKSNLQGADLSNAQLQATTLIGGQLQGANLSSAQLQCVELFASNLNGADLSNANLVGADLQEAQLYGANLDNSKTSLINARFIDLTPLTIDDRDKLSKEIKIALLNPLGYQIIHDRLIKASKNGFSKLKFESCLATDINYFTCSKPYDNKKSQEILTFSNLQQSYIANLASESKEIARGIITQLQYIQYTYSQAEENDQNDIVFMKYKIASILAKRLNSKTAPGLNVLFDDEKKILIAFAKKYPATKQ